MALRTLGNYESAGLLQVVYFIAEGYDGGYVCINEVGGGTGEFGSGIVFDPYAPTFPHPLPDPGPWMSAATTSSLVGTLRLDVHNVNDPHGGEGQWIWSGHTDGSDPATRGSDQRLPDSFWQFSWISGGGLTWYLTKPVVTPDAGDTTVDLDWTESERVEVIGSDVTYDVIRNGSVVASDLTGLSYTDTGLTNGLTYTYRIKAKWTVYDVLITRNGDSVTATPAGGDSSSPVALAVTFDSIETV